MKSGKNSPLTGNNNVSLRETLRTFRYRNYRLYFGGQGISLVGTWMQRIASGWLVYRLTNSVMLLGVVGFIGQIPSSVLSPLAGVVADRYDRRRMLLLTQVLAMVEAAIFAALVLTGKIQVWQIVVLSMFLGLVNAFDIPIRQSFIVEIVEKREDLGNAIAMNSAMFNGARLLGPSLAGIIIAVAGEGICFLLNALSFLAVIAALMAMKLKPTPAKARDRDFLEGIKEGFAYAAGFLPIRSVLLLLALISLVGIPYTTLMPVFARDVLRGGPHTLGFLVAFAGTGALIGAFYLASRRSVVGLKRIITLGAAVFGVGLIGFSLSRVWWFSMLLMLPTGFGMMVQMAASNTFLQTIVDDDKRGRIMSYYALAFIGTAPFGSLLAGSLAGRIGAPATVFLCGIGCILGAFWFAARIPVLQKMVHPIYTKKGVLPEVALGINTASELTRPPEV